MKSQKHGRKGLC